MRFCDKLPKIRKENNLSQEQLADRLGVSRQAVSKWESGASYPDMDKILQICKVLDCNLEDLLDDGTVGNSKPSKINLMNSLNDFLAFITKIYNMFCSMTFREKIKCILEMIFVGVLLFLAGGVICAVANDLIINFFLRIPTVGRFIFRIFESLMIIALLVISIIIFVHILKIRYLDYYVTVEDKDVKEKSLEKEVSEEKIIDNKKYIIEKDKPKIIIRDPKHSTLSFVHLLEKIVIFIIKIFTCLVACPIICIFVGSLAFSAISLCHIGCGIMFLWIAIALLGVALLSYVILYFMYNFIFNRENKFKLYFHLAITGIAIAALSSGLALIGFLNYEVVNNLDDVEKTVSTEYLDMKENTYIYCYGDDFEYVIDDSLTNIKVDITHPKEITYKILKNNNYYHIYANNYTNGFKLYKIITKDLKKGIIRDFDSTDMVDVKISLSQENYNKLTSNTE